MSRKPKACPGKYHWLLCRNCPEKVACGLRSVVAATFQHGGPHIKSQEVPA